MDINRLLSDGVSVAIIGLGIVFAILIIIWGLLEVLRLIFTNFDKQKEQKANIKTEKQVPQMPIPEAQSPKKETVEDEELVAVITAAIAASLNTSTYNLNIRSLKRVRNWKNASRQESIY